MLVPSYSLTPDPSGRYASLSEARVRDARALAVSMARYHRETGRPAVAYVLTIVGRQDRLDLPVWSVRSPGDSAAWGYTPLALRRAIRGLRKSGLLVRVNRERRS